MNSGANQSFTITPNLGYHIANVLVDGVSVGAVTSYAFTNVIANHTISATFAINTYTITPTAGANGTITPSSVQTVNSGASSTFAIAANSGYKIADVLVDGVSQGSITSYTFTNVTANHTISASFAINVNLGIAATYGAFGGTAGMTNTGVLTIINGDLGTTATAPTSITGFHDVPEGDIYTETGANIGTVNGTIFTCTHSTTGPNITGNATYCALATQARLDAQTAYLFLAAMPSGGVLAGNLAGTTIAPGVYTNSSSVLIQGGNLTLDAGGDANAIFVFQIGTTLTVGGPGAAFPQSIILAGNAKAKNVFWQVGSSATINAAGGGTMVGTIIAHDAITFSTVGNVTVTTLEGRALSLGAGVTMVDTHVNVPTP